MISVDPLTPKLQNNLMGPLSILVLLSIGISVSAQTQVPSSAKSTVRSRVTYLSEVDHSLVIEKISILPFIDNVGQVYSQSLTQAEYDFFDRGQQWMPVFSKSVEQSNAQLGVQSSGQSGELGLGGASENLSPEEVKRTSKADGSQAVLAGRLWKGPQGVQMRVVLYLASDGQPFLIETSDTIREFSTEEVSRELTKRLINIYQRVPVQGRILSRRGNDVTINLGKYHGVQTTDLINVVQIVLIERHPKNKFMLSHQKVLLGQLKILKADDFLSFGQVTMEKEPGVIQVGSNTKPDQFIQYSLAEDGTMKTLRERIGSRPDAEVSFGQKPEVWQPRQPPQYGRFQLAAGILQYNQNLALQSAGSLSASTSLGPTIALSGEAWLNQDWFVDLGFRQSAFAVKNALPGSSPGELNMSVNEYHVAGGYNYLIENDFWGPKIQLTLGLSQFSARADESTPLFLTNMNYGGMYLGFRGGFPLWQESAYDLGFQFKYYLTNGLTENKSSGSPSGVKTTDFGFFGSYKTKNGYNVIAELNFEYLTSSFSGASNRTDPASSISHKITSILAGIEYFF